jgi:TonB family protein
MKTSAIRSDWAGHIIDGRWPLLQWLGGSAWSGVFLTQLPADPSQKAVVKLVPADSPDTEAHIEARAFATTLSHPHLMRIFHHGRCQIEGDALVYTVTEYAGEILSQIIPERALTPAEAGEMLDPLLDALSYLHAKGLVHGHLKPSNILVVDDQLKLSVDTLHLAGADGADIPALTVHDAPEIANGSILPAADAWSLGVTLVEALSQQPPSWDRSTKIDPVVPESIPQPFADIARKCLRFDPARRCTLGEIKARLHPAPPAPAPPLPAPPLPAPAPKVDQAAPAKPRLMLLVIAAVVLLAVVAALQIRSHKTPSPPTQEPTQERPSEPASVGPSAPATQGSTVKGAVTTRVLPDVPAFAMRTIRGRVEVSIRVSVDPTGQVANATVESPGRSRYFARLSLEAAQRWRFRPAQVNGQAVSSVWNLQFQFTQTAIHVDPLETTP